MTVDPVHCPQCRQRMRQTHSAPYGRLRRKYRTCPGCGCRDVVLVRPAEVLSRRVLRTHNTSDPTTNGDPVN